MYCCNVMYVMVTVYYSNVMYVLVDDIMLLDVLTFFIAAM